MVKKKASLDKSSRVNQTGSNLLKNDDSISDLDERRIKRIEEITQVVNDRQLDQIASVAIDLDLISCDRNNRISIDQKWDEYQTLKKSIEKDGLINPPTVYINEERTEIVCMTGHLRIAALKELNVKSANCKYIHKPDQNKRRRIQLLENIARKNIHPVELADSLYQMELSGLTPEEISEESSIHLQTVRNYLNIGRWHGSVKSIIYENMSTFSKKSKGLQKLGWKAKKLSFSKNEIIEELKKLSGQTPAKKKPGGLHLRKLERARNILKEQQFSAIEVKTISKFLVKYDGVELNI